MKEYVSNKVQHYRQQKSITQQILADAVGVTRQTIIAIEKGNYTPSVVLAMKIASYFKVPIEKIFFMEYEK